MIAQLDRGLQRMLHISAVGHIRHCQSCGKSMDWWRAVSFETYCDRQAKVWCAECWDTLVRADPINKQMTHLDGRLLAAGIVRKPDPID